MNTKLLRLGLKMASVKSARSPGPAGLRPPLPSLSVQRLGPGQQPARLVAVRSFPPPTTTTCDSNPFSRLSSIFNLFKISKGPKLFHC